MCSNNEYNQININKNFKKNSNSKNIILNKDSKNTEIIQDSNDRNSSSDLNNSNILANEPNQKIIFNNIDSDINSDVLLSDTNILFTQLFNNENNFDFLINNIDENFASTDRNEYNLAYLLYYYKNKDILKQDNVIDINFIKASDIKLIETNFEYYIYSVNINWDIIQGPLSETGYQVNYNDTIPFIIKISRNNKIMSIRKNLWLNETVS